MEKLVKAGCILRIMTASVAAAMISAGEAPAAHAGASSVEDVTPAGITLQFIVRKAPKGEDGAPGVRRFFNHRPSDLVAYADAHGMTLYMGDAGKADVSTCPGECVNTWLPARAPAGAAAHGDWAAVPGPDGVPQWAFRGKVLYTCAQDDEIAVARCDASDGKKIALFQPSLGLAPPPPVSVREAIDLDALLLVDGQGRTLYRYVGDMEDIADACATPACADRFTPLNAPELARASGRFSPLTRRDGITQWAFDGKPLFTFDDDLDPGTVRGMGLSARWEPAVVAAHFRPAGVSLLSTSGRGTIWATDEGMTFYRKDAHHHIASGRGIARSDLPSPAVGMSIGTKGCDDTCLRKWHPFKAPEGAVPSGYWGIYVRADGTRQWAYKGYALYTYDEDKKPRDIKGSGLYDVFLDEGDGKFVDPGIAALVNASTPALYWAHAEP